MMATLIEGVNAWTQGGAEYGEAETLVDREMEGVIAGSHRRRALES